MSFTAHVFVLLMKVADTFAEIFWFCWCPVLCFKGKWNIPYEHSPVAILYVCVYVGDIIPYHDMLLIKCITCNLIGAKITVCDGCWCSSWSKNDSFFSLTLTFSVGKFYKCMINCVTTKHTCTCICRVHVRREHKCSIQVFAYRTFSQGEEFRY